MPRGFFRAPPVRNWTAAYHRNVQIPDKNRNFLTSFLEFSTPLFQRCYVELDQFFLHIRNQGRRSALKYAMVGTNRGGGAFYTHFLEKFENSFENLLNILTKKCFFYQKY